MSKEYSQLLKKARAATRESAKRLVPLMYEALKKEDLNLSPFDIRRRIETDCSQFWSRRTILEALPSEAKDPQKQQAGRTKKKGAAESAAQKVVTIDAATGRSIIEDAIDRSTRSDEHGCQSCHEKAAHIAELKEALRIDANMFTPAAQLPHTRILRLDLVKHGMKLKEILNGGRDCLLLVNQSEVLEVSSNYDELTECKKGVNND